MDQGHQTDHRRLCGVSRLARATAGARGVPSGVVHRDAPASDGTAGSATDGRRDRRQLAVEVAIALVVAGVAAVVTTWPLAVELRSLASGPADAPFQAWTIDWVQWAITGNAPLWDANIFAPNDHTLAYSDSLLGVAIPLLPLRWLGLNPLSQLNVALLLGMATSSAAGYLFGRVVSGHRAVGALTAAAFSFGPFATVAADHLHATIHVGVALAATGAWWLADRARSHRSLVPPGVLVAASIVWQMSVSFYPGTYAVLAVLAVVVCRWRDLGRRGRAALAVTLGVVVLGTLILALPYLAVASEGREFVRYSEDVAKLGADFTTADRRLEIWGPVLARDSSSTPAFPGLVLAVLAVAGLVTGFRSGGPERRTVVVGLVFLGLGAFLALGTAGDGWRAYSPYRLLFEFVPVFRILRAAARAWVLGLLGVGLLSGVGAMAVGRAVAGWRRRASTALVVGLAVLGVVAEGYSSWDGRPHITVSAVDEALASEPEDGGVVYLPAFVEEPPLQAVATTFGQVPNVYGTTAHHRRTPNGYSGVQPEEWLAFSVRMKALPSPATLEELRSIGVRFVVVRASVEGTPWETLLDTSAARPLRLVGRFDGDLLYEVPER